MAANRSAASERFDTPSNRSASARFPSMTPRSDLPDFFDVMLDIFAQATQNLKYPV